MTVLSSSLEAHVAKCVCACEGIAGGQAQAKWNGSNCCMHRMVLPMPGGACGQIGQAQGKWNGSNCCMHKKVMMPKPVVQGGSVPVMEHYLGWPVPI
eukprot:1140067-Pelagomonas_calceolata.AAC.2